MAEQRDNRAVQLRPLNPREVRDEEVRGLTGVDLREKSTRRIQPQGLPGFLITAIAGGILYDLVKQGAKWLLKDPDISLADRPPVLYHKPSQRLFRLQPDGSYRPDSQVIS
ncbi:MAG TPA: hypothetical protein VH703_02690 [Solirubrobacterales bacterium]|jgi:hypothetical protein